VKAAQNEQVKQSWELGGRFPVEARCVVVSSYTVIIWKKQKAGPSKKQSNSGEWEETARRAKKK
jgi:hypothetical protein